MEQADNSKKGVLIGLIVLLVAVAGIVALTQADPEPLQEGNETSVETSNEEKIALIDQAYYVSQGDADNIVKWEAKKIGGDHNGTVEAKYGVIEINDGQVTAEIEIDMSTIKTVDNGEGLPDLDVHLVSDDFFAVNEYPVATIKTKKVTHQFGNTYNVVADLEIRGITNEINFPATIVTIDKMAIINAEIPVDRTLFEVGTNSKLKSAAIDEEFTLDITLIGKVDMPTGI